jgi:hypothetical protein
MLWDGNIGTLPGSQVVVNVGALEKSMVRQSIAGDVSLLIT